MGEVAIIQYDPVGNVLSIQEAAGLSTLEYDERDSLVRARWSNGTQARYEYDERGDLLRAAIEPVDGSAEQVAEYAFDGLHRLRRMTRHLDWPNPRPVQQIQFEYDAAGVCAAYQT
jgi:YD repeat-containing protein